MKTQTPSKHNSFWVATTACALLLGVGNSPARANLITAQTVTLNPAGSDNNVTNGHTVTVFSLEPLFNMFDPKVGNLVSATLQWVASGSMVVGGNNEGQAIMSYASAADTETWNIYGGSTTLTFSLNGSESLDLAKVTGTTTFFPSLFTETYQLQQGFFPATFTARSTGTFTLEYSYYTGLPIAPFIAPEPSTITIAFGGLGLFALMSRGRFYAIRSVE